MCKTKNLLNLFSAHTRWLVACFLFGACILLIWPNSSADETDIYIPVDLEHIPHGLIATNLLKGIEVRVRGPKSVIDDLAKSEFRYKLELPDAEVGVKVIPIKKEHIRLPKELSIIEVTPSFLTLQVAREIKKELPVIVSFSGKPASGFFISDALAKPLSVIIKGPEHILSPMDKALTKPIDVTGLSESFQKEIALILPEDLEKIAPSGVILGKIVITEKIVTRKFRDIVVEGKNTSHAFSIAPPLIEIEVKGPANILEQLQTEQGINVHVNLKNLKPGVYVRRATITLPLKTSLVGVNPEIFTIKIMEKRSRRFKENTRPTNQR